jgi:hypothetical protein
VDLGLDDPDRTAEGFSPLDGLIDRKGGKAAWNRNAELFEDGLGLMLVNVHEVRSRLEDRGKHSTEHRFGTNLEPRYRDG